MLNKGDELKVKKQFTSVCKYKKIIKKGWILKVVSTKKLDNGRVHIRYKRATKTYVIDLASIRRNCFPLVMLNKGDKLEVKKQFTSVCNQKKVIKEGWILTVVSTKELDDGRVRIRYPRSRRPYVIDLASIK